MDGAGDPRPHAAGETSTPLGSRSGSSSLASLARSSSKNLAAAAAQRSASSARLSLDAAVSDERWRTTVTNQAVVAAALAAAAPELGAVDPAAFEIIDPAGQRYFVDAGRWCFLRPHLETHGTPTVDLTPYADNWRNRDRMKTVSVAIMLCLNIGVDPPDVIKTKPCARLECWIDPFSQPPQRAIEAISQALQTQYERWQPRARYKAAMDPTAEDARKLCSSLRRNSRDERILFHYNGHGVPRPTPNGEIWVFNKNFTQYIPLSVYDLQTWMGSPSIFVYDCSGAGHILNAFNMYAEQREREYEKALASGQLDTADPNTVVQPMRDCIQLAACGANEILPMNPNLPADLFTSCLTTPIEIAIRYFILQNPLMTSLSLDVVDKIPGRLNDRRTPLGELNWIFTAITDTIAWNVLPRELFQKLFRQDLLLASLFRNYLLADRIMRSYNATPMSSPKLPPTHQHPLWASWDLAADLCLSQMPKLLNGTGEYVHSPFFSEQLQAFQVWLETANDHKRPPEQLPIVLQVLLSQSHRLRALRLLAQFLDLGPWAVNLALSVGIFPYVLKLLQSAATELRAVLVHVWSKIMVVDRSCQADLIKDQGFRYFSAVLWAAGVPSTERAESAVVLAISCKDFPLAQQSCIRMGAISQCLAQLNDPDPMLRQWLCLYLAEMWANNPEAKGMALRDNAAEPLQGLLSDPVPAVRAAVVYALGRFFGHPDRIEHVVHVEHQIAVALVIVTADCSPMVRRELAIAVSAFVHLNEHEFRVVAQEMWEEDMRRAANPPADGRPDARRSLPTTFFGGTPSIQLGIANSTSVHQCLWKVAEQAQMIVDAIHASFEPAQPPPAPVTAPPVERPRPKHANKRTASTLLGLIGGAAESQSQDEAAARDPTSPLALTRAWRRKRNERIARDAMPAQIAAQFRRFDEQVHILDNEAETVAHLRFFAYEPKLVVGDGRDGIAYACVWDLTDGSKRNFFTNRNPPHTRLTALNLVNEDDVPLLLTGSDDGVVRLWRNFDDPHRVSQLTAWRALGDMLVGNRGAGAGLVMEWQQRRASLIVSGDTRVIRIWDVERELCAQDIRTSSESCITTIASDRLRGDLIVAGCGDGYVRVYDRRLPPKESMVMASQDHRSWVVGASWQRFGDGEVVTGSTQGEVKFWDLRSRRGHALRTVEAHTQGMSAMAVHAYAPVVATGTSLQQVKVFTNDGQSLSTIRYHDGFLGQRIGPISSLAFHPHQMLMAVGSTDSLVSIFTSERAVPGTGAAA